jgi:3-oxoacyl-[acyl-carrier-protein] synthase-3
MNTDSVGVLKNGVALGIETYRKFKDLLNLREDQPDRIICHQVGVTHQNTILKSIGIPKERDFTTFRYLGNIGTVSLPITAAIAEERGVLQPDDMVGLLGIGSGLNCIMLGVQW